jgi:hypothetical protein
MSVNLPIYFVVGMILLECTSRYYLVSSVPEDDSSLGSRVFVSAVSIYGTAHLLFIVLNFWVTDNLRNNNF